MRSRVAITTGVVLSAAALGVSYLAVADNPPPRNEGAEVAVRMTLRDDGVRVERVRCTGDPQYMAKQWCSVRLTGGTVRVQVEPTTAWPGWRIIPAHMP